MKQPPGIEPAPRPGPDYDPMDRIVKDIENVQSFISYLGDRPDEKYLDSHLPQILVLRRTIAEQLTKLSEDPYSYQPGRVTKLQKENEEIFTYLEGIAGAVKANDTKELKRFLKICESAMIQFDDDLTP